MNRILKRIAKHGIENRDDALVWLDGNFYEGEGAHGYMVDNYIKNRSLTPQVIREYYTIGNGKDQNLSEEEIQELIDKGELTPEIKEDLVEYTRRSLGINCIRYAPLHRVGAELYIASDCLENCQLNEVLAATIDEFPEYEIYDDVTENRLYWPDQKLNGPVEIPLRFPSSLKEEDDVDDIVFGDLTEYIRKQVPDVMRIECSFDFGDNLLSVWFSTQQEIDNIDEQITNAVKSFMSTNFSENSQKAASKFHYKNRIAKIPMNRLSKRIMYMTSKYRFASKRKNRIAKIILALHGEENRDSALIYIDGEFREGPLHPDMVVQWFAEREMNELLEFINNYYTTGSGTGTKSDEDLQKILKDAKESKELPFEIYKALGERNRKVVGMPIPYAAIHKVNTDFGTVYYIDKNTMENCELKDVVPALHAKDSNGIIISEDRNTDKEELQWAPENMPQEAEAYKQFRETEFNLRIRITEINKEVDHAIKTLTRKEFDSLNLKSKIENYLKEQISDIQEIDVSYSNRGEFDFEVKVLTATTVAQLKQWIHTKFIAFIKEHPNDFE